MAIFSFTTTERENFVLEKTVETKQSNDSNQGIKSLIRISKMRGNVIFCFTTKVKHKLIIFAKLPKMYYLSLNAATNYYNVPKFKLCYYSKCLLIFNLVWYKSFHRL